LGERIAGCRPAIVVAGDLDHPVAQLLAYSLSGIGISATAPAGEGLTLCQLRAVTPEDACLGIGFRRCLRVPVEAISTARARGAFTLAITDSDSTPVARHAERSLLAPIDAESFAGSYVGPLAAINALLVSCAHANPERTLALLKPTEAEYRDGLRWYREPARERTSRASSDDVRKGDGQSACDKETQTQPAHRAVVGSNTIPDLGEDLGTGSRRGLRDRRGRARG